MQNPTGDGFRRSPLRDHLASGAGTDRDPERVGDRPSGRPVRDLMGLPLVVGLGRGAVRLLGATLRFRELNREAVEALWSARSPLIYAAWHGRILMLPYLYGERRVVHVLASRSRDGELLTRFVRGFGVRVVRGSTSRGGAAALRTLARLLREAGGEVVVVPDGPRGPRYVAQPGPVLLAKLSGAPIIPVGFGVSRGTVLGSWDEFVIPHPFAQAAVVFGEPIAVASDTDRDALERHRQVLEQALRRITAEADRVVGAPRVPRL